ncbi:DUF1800 domain-containing protein [Aquabacterium olei]|nr:DUF1800 domain-containing protein [Aquabacterium olei]
MQDLLSNIVTRPLLAGATLFAAGFLSACGGGGAGESTATVAVASQAIGESAQAAGIVLVKSTTDAPNYAASAPTTSIDAHRFLSQATFGPSDSSVAEVKARTYGAWIDGQLVMPLSISHQQLATERNAATGGKHQFFYGFWQKALTSPDQLRQRMAFALSQIFVVSFADQCGASSGIGVASFYDTLTKNAFGSYRDLLQAVSLHPMMGCYLSHLRNQKADPVTGRVPDENYAREILQLFSIGLVQLNTDGTPKRDTAGKEIESYSQGDVSELARVFTGFSWDCPDYPADNCFKFWGTSTRAGFQDPWTIPMRGYPKFHDGGSKTILGRAITSQADPMATLKQALDIISTHPNVAPFISRQIIQRFVTSNPSRAYVSRVAAKFTSSGGNLGQTLKAALLDDEARNPTLAQGAAYGKVKEPILRYSNLLRAYAATSTSGNYLIGNTREAAYGLNQAPMFSPSVFNFYRPGYVAPGSKTGAVAMVAPELQIADETSMAGYISFLANTISTGAGNYGYDGRGSAPDVQFPFNLSASHPIRKLAENPSELAQHINTALFGGGMSTELRADLVEAMNSIDYRSRTNPTQAQIDSTFQRRVWTALTLAVASPEFLVQK